MAASIALKPSAMELPAPDGKFVRCTDQRVNGGCYLYYEGSRPWGDGNGGGGRVTTGPRVVDPLTARAENMTKEEFSAFQKDQVDHVTQKFMEDMRHAILSQNEHGEFLSHRISPSVLTDDWVLRATEFVQKICEQQQQQQQQHPSDNKAVTIGLAMTLKRKHLYVEGWLVIQQTPGDNSVPLVMFTKREDPALQSCLDRIMKEVHSVLTKSFPYCAVLPLKDTQELWLSAEASLAHPEQGFDGGVKSALERIQMMESQGASKADIKAEMRRMRSLRRAHLKATTDADKQPVKDISKDRFSNTKKRSNTTSTQKPTEAAATDEKSLSKTKERSVWDALVLSKRRYWENYARPWAWRGLVAAVSLYYVYWLMRNWVVRAP